tara:strand:+ start:5155 stop:5811 length:657 start_codon:yes stop_codon:yes gene_type:complete
MSSPIHLPNYRQIPKPSSKEKYFKLKVKELRPTQICIGLSEVLSRKEEFSKENKNQRLDYLYRKPVPIVSNQKNDLWMLDRHHRLRALIELDNETEAYGYLVAKVDSSNNEDVLNFLSQQGWLYLFNSRGIGPQLPASLPENLLKMQDDPYRSLVWRLKKDGLISPQPLIPYHEFRWSSWLRSRSLPPFNSKNLAPALTVARALASSQAASHLAGWKK